MELQLSAEAISRRDRLILEAQLMRMSQGMLEIMERIQMWQCEPKGAKDDGLRQLLRLATEAIAGANAIEKELRR